MCHEVQKSAPAAWSDSYILLFDQNVVFLGINQLVRKTAFSWVVAQFSTIFENVMSCHIIVLESNWFQKSLLREKSAPAAWSDSYIFLFDQNVVFLGFNQLVRKPAFSWVTAQFSTIFEMSSKTVIRQDITFSKMVENCLTTQENAGFLTSWLKPRKTAFWSKRKM